MLSPRFVRKRPPRRTTRLQTSLPRTSAQQDGPKGSSALCRKGFAGAHHNEQLGDGVEAEYEKGEENLVIMWPGTMPQSGTSLS